jgi:anti-sigma-K factor RskA
MNIQEYISSGIIESYVLGLASEEERAEFEKLCRQYPELVNARNNFELALEEQARQNTVAPPADVKQKISSAIQKTSATSPSKIISMESTKRRSSGLRWFAAASVILFLLSTLIAYMLFNKNRELQAKIEKNDSLINSITVEQKIMHDPNTMVVNMVGLKGSPSSANIYWDSTSSDVYLIVKNMPKLASDKQYQLWALIDNKPLDLGAFDQPQPNVILKMKNTQKADAFAITIETRGNTAGPTLQNLQAMGKAKL